MRRASGTLLDRHLHLALGAEVGGSRFAVGAYGFWRAHVRAHDVSVIGFDDIGESERAGLTTISQPAAERGRLSGQLLLDPPKDHTGRQIVLPTELIIRDSTRPVTTKE
jgi:DNA-binding LacI/PurR family transcriptional regulator